MESERDVVGSDASSNGIMGIQRRGCCLLSRSPGPVAQNRWPDVLAFTGHSIILKNKPDSPTNKPERGAYVKVEVSGSRVKQGCDARRHFDYSVVRLVNTNELPSTHWTAALELLRGQTKIR